MIEILEQNPKTPSGAMDYYKKLVPMVYNQGFFGVFGLLKRVAVAIVGVVKPVPREPVCESDMRAWAIKSTALGCENLMLAFSAQGYDTCPMEGMDSKRVARALGLARDAIVVMGIAAGKRDDGGLYGPQIRFDRNLFVKEV